MMTRLSFLTLAMVGVAGLAHAQSTSAPATAAPGSSMPPAATTTESSPSQAMAPDSARYDTAFKDEYGFRYNSRGDRLDANGHIMPPPVTPPGVAALR